MNLETWNVKIKVDTSQVKNASSTVKNSFSGMSANAAATTEAVSKLNSSVRTLTGINLVTNWTKLKKVVDGVNLSITKVAKNFKNIFAETTKLRDIMTATKVALMPKDLNYADRRIFGFNTEKEVNSLSQLQLRLMATGVAVKSLAGLIKGVLVAAFKALKYVVTSVIAPLLILIGLIKQIKGAVSIAEVGDSIRDSAQKVHMSTVAYQEWGYVLKQNGIEISSLNTLMRTFGKSVANNDPALKKYGITATNISEAFAQAVESIQRMDSETKKLAAATELFGNRAAELMPLLNMQVEDTKKLMETYRAIGGTMSNEMIAASDKLTDSITELKVAWQGLKNALVMQIMPVLVKVVQWLTVAIAKITIFIKAVLGIKETFTDTSESSNGISAGLNGATESAKKLKKQLLGIDELNIFQGNDDTALSDMEDMNYGVSFDMGNFDTSVLDKISDFREKIEGIQDEIRIATPILLTGIGLLIALTCLVHGNIAGAIAGLAIAGMGITLGKSNGAWKDMFNGIKDAVSDIQGPALMGIGLTVALLSGLSGNLVGVGIGLGLAGIGLGITAINNQWGDLKQGIKSFVSDIVPVAMQGVGVGLMLVAGMTANLPLLMLGAGIAGLGIAVQSSGGWSGYAEKMKQSVNTLLDWFKEKVLPIFTAQYWSDKWNTVKNSASTKIEEIKNTINSKWSNLKTMSSNWMEDIKKDIGTKWTGIKTDTSTKMDEMKKSVSDKFTTLKTITSTKMSEVKTTLSTKHSEIQSWFNTSVVPMFDKTTWSNRWNNIKTNVDTNMTSIKTTLSTKWSSIKTWFDTSVGKIFTASYWSTKFTTMKNSAISGIKSVINGAIDKLESGINGIVRKINGSGIIGGINKLTNLGLGFSEIKIPRLAKGGALYTPTIAQVGEYAGARTNPEIVAPQSVILETLNMSNEALISAFAQMTRQIITAIESKEDSITIGDDVIAKSAARGNNAYKKMTGASLF